MPKFLGQAGISLADNYDVEGSIARADQLNTEDGVFLYDEQGGRIHSERLNSFILHFSSTAIAQNTVFDIVLGGIPDSVNRILGAYVVFNTTARLASANIAIQEIDGSAEFSIFSWGETNDAERRTRMSIDGAAAGNVSVCIPLGMGSNAGPNLITRMGAEFLIPQMIFRGSSNGFGAGTVIATAIVLLARPDRGNPRPGEPSSHGLPLPGW